MLYSFAGTFDGSRIITLLNLFLCGTFLPLSAQSLDSPAILTKIVLFWFLIFSFLLRFSGFPFPYRSLQLRVCSVKKKKKNKYKMGVCLLFLYLAFFFFDVCVQIAHSTILWTVVVFTQEFNCFPGSVRVSPQSCLTLHGPRNCSLPGSSVHGIFSQEYWSGLPFPSPGNLPNPGMEPGSPAQQACTLTTEPQESP